MRDEVMSVHAIAPSERRAWLLKALEGGPYFVWQLQRREEFEGIARTTIQNDLKTLIKAGSVIVGDDGYRLNVKKSRRLPPAST